MTIRIQLITRHYWPDETPAARLHHALCERLASEGHEVHVYTTVADRYLKRTALESNKQSPVSLSRVRLLPEQKHRMLVRLLNVVYFQIRALWHALFCPTDLLIVGSYPPVAPGFCVWLVHCARRIPYIYHCMDIQPEGAALAGKIRKPWLVKLLQRMDRATCRQAAAVVTLSEEMAVTLRSRGWTGDSIRIINNFHTESPSKHPPPQEQSEATYQRLLPAVPAESMRLIFAGNLGSFQGLDRLVQAALLLEHRHDIQFVFMGRGEQETSLRQQASRLVGKTVHFVPFQPTHIASQVVQASDLAVISLLPEVFRTAIPSKTMMYLRVGCPLLALIEPDCELASLVRTHRLGTVPATRNAQLIAQAIEKINDDARATQLERRRLIKTGEQLFGYEPTLDKWCRLIASYGPSGSSRSKAA